MSDRAEQAAEGGMTARPGMAKGRVLDAASTDVLILAAPRDAELADRALTGAVSPAGAARTSRSCSPSSPRPPGPCSSRRSA